VLEKKGIRETHSGADDASNNCDPTCERKPEKRQTGKEVAVKV